MPFSRNSMHCFVMRRAQELRRINVAVETGSGPMGRDVRLQTGRGFQPIVHVMTGLAAALLIEMKGVFADIFVFRFRKNERKGRVIFHEWFYV
jgi:hypothetical protein